MSDTGITDDFMNRFTMPSVNVMGGHNETHISETQSISSDTSSPRVRHVNYNPHPQRKWSYHNDAIIGWTHNFDYYHRPGRKQSETIHNRGLNKMGSAEDFQDTHAHKGEEGFFGKIRSAFHL